MHAVVLALDAASGTGRVRVGEVELAFDVTVARSPLARLAPGQPVEVELGPSRLGGSRIVRLSIPDEEPPPPPTVTVDQRVAVGAYTLMLDHSWTHVEVVEKPGLARMGGVAGPGASFDFSVFVDGAGDPSLASRLVSKYADAHGGSGHTRFAAAIAQQPFEGHAFDRSPVLAPGSLYELYVGPVYDDLLVVGFGLTHAARTYHSAWQRLFTTIAAAAILRLPPR